MYKLKEIADKVYYVGVNDRQKALFENMWPLPYGVSYNSYLIVDEKTVLIDTVDVCYSDIFLKKVADALDGRSLDYLVVNHMEPDHAGSIITNIYIHKICKRMFYFIQKSFTFKPFILFGKDLFFIYFTLLNNMTTGSYFPRLTENLFFRSNMFSRFIIKHISGRNLYNRLF